MIYSYTCMLSTVVSKNMKLVFLTMSILKYCHISSQKLSIYSSRGLLLDKIGA